MKSIQSLIHHLFIPHRKNNYRAKALHHDFLTAYLLIAITLSIGIKLLPTYNSGSVLGYATDITTQKLFESTNKEREKANLPPLTYNEKLATAANAKAHNMFELNYWAHYSPSGATPWNYILAAGYEYEYAGENLAKNFLFSDGVVKAWMNSPSHKENLLRPEYTDVGFAVVNGTLNGEETTLVVQMFGKPLQGDAVTDSRTQVVEEKAAPKTNPAVESKPAVLPESTQKISFMTLYHNGTFLFFLFLVIALIADFYVAAKLNLVRVTGKNILHVIFLGFIIIAVWIIAKGSII